MRLSGGELGSRVIRSPHGAAIRPTPGRVREALFSMVATQMAGARVLDLYAGTGAIGFEALSRGAASATFVELHAPTAQAIRRAAAELGVAARATILCAPVEKAAQRLSGRFDFVYADPPYALPPPHLTFSTLRARGSVDAATVLVYEHREASHPFSAPGFETVRDARYGEVTLQFLRATA
ncbi:MAG: 16S rRNA (guanine(966)-N(2))-methyltransferase RsmD [Candidatus Eremiobacteraeota bacterium]|nr:16S rRNA (guanine(966)-N(2))-methyltransferase RsmD [Candidatus Eremiobacteraeota bacterium]MBC5801595.1 16S rRNA (guanine(966)-N(2))-methyltransferase RsmD [Candidatus Eremiobacteraeota bacterium]MBC5822641.1 16S rRNA (guanine(966)-N(2))-methyltransferase RsmD [Candidatus Eremiobacteraeota bacterium]